VACLNAKFDAMAIRKGHKKSIVALAHKMLRIVYAMLCSATFCQDRSVDDEALSVAENAPRWIRMLRKYTCGSCRGDREDLQVSTTKPLSWL
jgi:hypothetical protein